MYSSTRQTEVYCAVIQQLTIIVLLQKWRLSMMQTKEKCTVFQWRFTHVTITEETKVYPRFEVVPCGIGDVFGGRMWFCVKPNNPHEVVYFDTKQKCEQYIRKYHNSDPHLLKVLRNTHGRSIIYA